MQLSLDQAEAFDTVSDVLRHAGVDLDSAEILPAAKPTPRTLAVLGNAGSGKTMLLAKIVEALEEAGAEVVSADYEGRKKGDRRSFAVLAPTNKAASVLRNRGVPATTIHRILYTPMYDPEYEKFAEWLTDSGDPPEIEGLTDTNLNRAADYYKNTKSIPGALAAAGLRGSR